MCRSTRAYRVTRRPPCDYNTRSVQARRTSHPQTTTTTATMTTRRGRRRPATVIIDTAFPPPTAVKKRACCRHAVPRRRSCIVNSLGGFPTYPVFQRRCSTPSFKWIEFLLHTLHARNFVIIIS